MAYELGILFGLLSMLGFGLSNAVSQKIVRKIGTLSTMVWQSLVVIFVLFPVFFMYPAGFVFSWELLLVSAGIGLIGVVPLFTFYKALDVGKVGIVVPVANSFGLFTILFSVILLGEVLAASQILPIAMIILGVILISMKISDIKSGIAAGVPYAAITSVLWGAYFFLLNYPVSVLGPVFTAAFTQLALMFFSAVYAWKSGNLKYGMDAGTKKLILLSGVALATGVGAFNVGITMAKISIIAPLLSAAPLVAAVYAMIVYKEKLSKTQYFAILTIVTGIILLSI